MTSTATGKEGKEGQSPISRANRDGTAVRLAHGYPYDADGNLVEAYVAADMNCDGVLNNFDVDAFVLALTNLPGYYLQYPNCNYLNGVPLASWRSTRPRSARSPRPDRRSSGARPIASDNHLSSCAIPQRPSNS